MAALHVPCKQTLLHGDAPDCPTESRSGSPELLAAAQPSPWLRPAKCTELKSDNAGKSTEGQQATNAKEGGSRMQRRLTTKRRTDRGGQQVAAHIHGTGKAKRKEEAAQAHEKRRRTQKQNNQTNETTTQNNTTTGAHAPGQSAVRCIRQTTKKQGERKNRNNETQATHRNNQQHTTKRAQKQGATVPRKICFN